MTNINDSIDNTTLVIESEVSQDKEVEFRQWQNEIMAASRQFEGYIGTDFFPPVKGIQDKWYTIVHFDNPTNLTRWLESEIRYQLIQKRPSSATYKFMGGFQTGLEGLCIEPKQTVILPRWKQALSILLGLYPTLMVESLLFSYLGFMKSWPHPAAVLLTNFITCCLLTWIVMPLVRKLIRFWLQPKIPSLQTDLIGTLLIFLCLGFMLSIFMQIG